MNFKRIEEIVRSKMIQGETHSHTDEIWANIEDRLPRKKRSRKYIVLLVLPFLIGGVYYTSSLYNSGDDITQHVDFIAESDEELVIEKDMTRDQKQGEAKVSLPLDQPSKKTEVVEPKPKVEALKSESNSDTKQAKEKKAEIFSDAEKDFIQKTSSSIFRKISLDEGEQKSVIHTTAINSKLEGLFNDVEVDLLPTKIAEVLSPDKYDKLNSSEAEQIDWLKRSFGNPFFLSVYSGIYRNMGRLGGASLDPMDEINPLETKSFGVNLGKIKGSWKLSAGIERRESVWNLKDEITYYNQELGLTARSFVIQNIDGSVEQASGTVTETSTATKKYDVHSRHVSWRIPLNISYFKESGKWRYSGGVGLGVVVSDELETYAYPGSLAAFAIANTGADIDPVQVNLHRNLTYLDGMISLQLERMLAYDLGISISAQYQRALTKVQWENPIDIELDGEQVGLAVSVAKYW